MADVRNNSSRRSARLSSAGSVAITPPRSPAVNRVPSSHLMKQVETPSTPSKWQRQHEQTTFRQLSFQRDTKKTCVKASKEKALKLTRKIPTEMLAKEWMNDNQVTLDARAYLVENILPTLIIGVEKLLIEADKLELTGKDERDANFNPVNYLAQYLMRNNPRYCNLSEASPYVKSLREIGETLKAQIFQLEDNKLARIKNEAKRKREEREKAAEQKKLEAARRKTALEEQFLDWTNDKEGKVEVALVQSALKSFSDMVEHLPEELQPMAEYAQTMDATDDTGRTLVVRDFYEFISNFVEEYPAPLFDQFVKHLKRCATAYHAEVEREQRKATLSNIFYACDNSGVGVLDRHRILSLFESFYDKQPEDSKKQMKLRNPRKWPVVEVDEADSESEDEEASPTKTAASQSTSVTSTTDPPSTSLETAETPGETPAEASPARPGTAEEKHEDEATEKEAPKKEEDGGEKAAADTDTPADASQDAQPAASEQQGEGETAEGHTEEAKDTVAPLTEAAKTEEVPVEQSDTELSIRAEAPSTDAVASPAAVAEGEGTNAVVEETTAVREETVHVVEGERTAAADAVLPGEGEDAPTQDQTSEALADPTLPPSSGSEENPEPAEEVAGPTTLTVPERSTLSASMHEPTTDQALKEVDEDSQSEIKLIAEKVVSASVEHGTGLKREATRGGAFSVSFAEGTNLERERTMLTTRGTGSQSQMSAFDENTINISQFVQLTETFLGDSPALDIFQALCHYMRNGYVETEEEKIARLMKAHKEVQLMKQRARVDNLFEKWDNEGSGYLDIEEIETIIHKYKDGLERQAINRAKYKCLQKSKLNTGQSDTRLTKSEFRDLIYTICEEIPGDETFEFFVDFVESCVERTYAEKIRGEARKKWLVQIVDSADTSAASLETVYRSVFQALYRDAETHGNGKVISSNIAILERNFKVPNRGDNSLRYIAATSDDSSFLLNKLLYKDMKGISFAAVESGKPLHVPRVSNHGNIQFWNPDRAEDDREGSLVVVPLKDKRKRVFGILGLDTLRDPHAKSIFITHEIQFYQGVAKAFSIAYHKVDAKRKTLRIVESAVSWICRRSESVHEINVYLVEPDGKNEDYVLRRMMVAQGEKDVKTFKIPSRLERKDNLFRDYLFKCVDNSETVTADAYGQRHFAFPLRGGDGRALAVVDISTGNGDSMPKYERKEMLRMLKLVQKAQKEINRETSDGEKTVVLEAEKESEDVRVEVMFDRLMLLDLRKNVAKLDARAYAELKSYPTPPKVIHKILKATLSLFYPDKAKTNAFDDWGVCKQLINSDLNTKIQKFDPTAEGAENIPAYAIGEPLNDIPHGLVAKHSSAPAECLYNWIFVCLSLIQHTKRMRLAESSMERAGSMLPTGMTPDVTSRDDDE